MQMVIVRRRILYSRTLKMCVKKADKGLRVREADLWECAGFGREGRGRGPYRSQACLRGLKAPFSSSGPMLLPLYSAFFK